MKHTLLLSLGALALAPVQAATDLVAGWDFNTASGGTTLNVYRPSNGSQKTTAGIYVDGTVGSSNLIEPSGPSTFNSGERSVAGSGFVVGTSFLTTDNTDLFTSFSTTNNKEFQLYTNTAAGVPNNTLNGKSIVFGFSSLGLTDLIIQMAVERGSIGPNDNTWSWSTNGTTYNNFATAWNPPTAVDLYSLDLSALAAVENQANVYVKLTLGGQGVGTGSSNYLKFDNFQVGGVIPEPSTWAALAGLGVLGAALVRRRRALRA